MSGIGVGGGIGIGRDTGYSSSSTCHCGYEKNFDPLPLPLDPKVSELTDKYIGNVLESKRSKGALGMGVFVTGLCTLGGPAGWAASALLALPAGFLTSGFIYATGGTSEREKSLTAYLVSEILTDHPHASEEEVFEYVTQNRGQYEVYYRCSRCDYD